MVGIELVWPSHLPRIGGVSLAVVWLAGGGDDGLRALNSAVAGGRFWVGRSLESALVELSNRMTWIGIRGRARQVHRCESNNQQLSFCCATLRGHFCHSGIVSFGLCCP